ncbi:MAG: hypothetical protein IJ776_08935 [Paludibacteraceae bacterium]|nr:hypothetical protein [Paludibacteraceae bacterium]
MRKLSIALLCISMLAFVPACNPVEPEQQGTEQGENGNGNSNGNENGNGNQNNQGNEGNTNEDEGLTNWQKCLKHVAPGIYQGLPDQIYFGMEMDYQNEILAICADGSAFVIEDLTEGDVIAPITAYDGNLTFHEITAQNDSKRGLIYDDVVTVYSKDKLVSFGNTAGWIDAQLTLFAGFFGFDDYFYQGKMIETYFKKIDEATDFNSTYEKIFNLAKKQGSFVALNDLFHPTYTIYNDGWHSELYPEDMNTKRWVVPYDGTGKIERFCVKCQRGWEGGGKRFIFYGPCNWENVTYVECDVVCEYDQAKYWFDKITAMTDRYNKVYEPKTLCVDGEYDLLGDGSYMVNITTAGYQYYSEPESDDEGHHYGYDADGVRRRFTDDEEDFGSGYVHPEYKMQWTKPSYDLITPMSIEFSVNYVTWV